MKAFASALLLAGVHATAGAIDFAIVAKATMVSLSTNYDFLKQYGKKASGVLVHDDTQVSWDLSTNHASKQFTLKMIMVGSFEGAITASKTAMEMYQCWKDYTVTEASTAGLKGLRCHVFQIAATANAGKATAFYRQYKMKTPAVALDVATDLPSNTGGTYLFHKDTSSGNKGFLTTAKFTEAYHAQLAEATMANTAADVTLAEAAIVPGGTPAFGTVDLTAKPKVSKAPAGVANAGYKWTVEVTVTPGA